MGCLTLHTTEELPFTVSLGGLYSSSEKTLGTERKSFFGGVKGNHLGNVRVVISDARNSIGLTSVTAAYDYYPFGKISRSLDGGTRHTFNGKEYDRELGWQDYGMRMYNPDLGRFPSVDPLAYEFPMLSPYQYACNNPIKNIDIDGLEGGNANDYFFTLMGQAVQQVYYNMEYETEKAKQKVHSVANTAWKNSKDFGNNMKNLLTGEVGIVIYGSGEFKGQVEMGSDRNGRMQVQSLDLGNPENVFSVLQLRNTGPSKDAFESLGNVLTDNHPIHSIKIKFDEDTEYNYFEKSSKYTDKDGTTLYYSPFEDEKQRQKNDGRATLYRAITNRDKETGDIIGYDIEPVSADEIIQKE